MIRWLRRLIRRLIRRRAAREEARRRWDEPRYATQAPQDTRAAMFGDEQYPPEAREPDRTYWEHTASPGCECTMCVPPECSSHAGIPSTELTVENLRRAIDRLPVGPGRGQRIIDEIRRIRPEDLRALGVDANPALGTPPAMLATPAPREPDPGCSPFYVPPHRSGLR